jgi:CheY-like chemotaxis protein
MMGGAIGVESSVGAGSVFWFELASAAAPELVAEGAGLAAEPKGRDPQDAMLRTLLYVEDNTANLKLVEQLVCRRRDVRLLSAGNATLGIEIARASLPDVILMDINLPGINGYQALEILQEDPVTAHIPVLAISANAMRGDIKKGLEAGFFRYLTKPIHVNEFMEAMDAVLEVARKKGSTRMVEPP